MKKSFRQSVDDIKHLMTPNSETPAEQNEKASPEKIVGNIAIDTIVKGVTDFFKTSIAKKLDKGAYSGDAQSLKNDIDNVSKKIMTPVGGAGLTSSASGTNVTLNVVSATDGIKVNPDNIQLMVVNDLTSGGATKALAAAQGPIIKQMLQTLAQGVSQTQFYTGTLTKNSKSIAVGKTMYKPSLYLDGIRIDSKSFSVSGTTINLTEVYSSKYDVTWEVEDRTPTPMNLSSYAMTKSHILSLGQESDEELNKPFIAKATLEEANIYDIGKDIEDFTMITFDFGQGNLKSIPIEVLIDKKKFNCPIYIINEEDGTYDTIILMIEFVTNRTFKITSIIYGATKIQQKSIECQITLTR